MSPGDQPVSAPPALITTGGVFLPAEVCGPLWRLLRAELDRHTRNGGQVRPEIAAARDALRASHLAHVSANGHAERTGEDISASSTTQAFVTTDQLAGRLGVTTRQARRIAQAAFVTPVTRGLWRAEDAAELAAARPRRHR